MTSTSSPILSPMKALRDYLQSHGELFVDVLELATCGFYLRPLKSNETSSGETGPSQPPLFSQLCFSSLGFEAPSAERAVTGWLDLVHPDDRERLDRRVWANASKSDADAEPLQYRLRRNDGTYRYTEERGRRITPGNQQDAFWLGVLHDVDDRLRSKQELEASHQEIQTILDTIPTLVWIKDESHRILRVNRAAADASGMSADQIEGKLTSEVYPKQGERFQASDRQLMQGTQPVRRISETLENKNGENYKMLIDKYSMPSLHAEDKRILVVGTDITEIEQTQYALARQEAQFRNLFERSPMGSVLIDSAHQLQLINSRIEAMYQLKPTQDRPTRLTDLVPPEFHDRLTPPRGRFSREAAASTQFEFETVRADGTAMRINLVTAAIEIENQPMTLATFTDITERHRVSMELQSKQEELERSNEDLDRFAYIASHDLKAPLRGIMHLTEWIDEDMPRQVGQDVREHLKMLQTQVGRMDMLLNDLLAYARVTRQTETVEWVDLNIALPEIFAFMSPPATMKLVVPEKLPGLSTARGPLEQIFRNLFGNSIKHAANSRQISVTAKISSDEYQFTVRDFGPGIPEGSQERIFGMFQTLESGKDRRGTGMGLHLVKRLVQVQGCDAWAESQPGEGAAFHFTWPRENAAAAIMTQTAYAG
ncbi:MAG: PAS domain S-box protein [Rhodopirellula bahusiensis]